ncbi:MAG: DMT family transporter [Clostridia bacterium]|nr:DMT family transporter [Clostridia bacterium]MBQ3124867.1 DMT family transporter [Clostridia bacterium]
MIFVTFAALLCCALWGSATPFIKTGYLLMLPAKDVPSTILFAGIRFTFAGILTVLIYSIARRKFLYPKRKNIGRVALVASVQTVIQYIFFYVGLANTTGVKGTILTGSNAFFALLIASLIFRQEKLTVRKVVACLIGFSGIILVNLNGLSFNMNFTGDCFVLFSSISYAFSSVLIKIFSKDEDPVVISGYQFMMGGLFMVILGFMLGGNVVVGSFKAFGVLAYLSLLSAIAYSLWGVLLKHNPVSRVSIFNFMTPVMGVILSAIMLPEESNVELFNLIITMILVSGGIILLNYKKQD